MCHEVLWTKHCRKDSTKIVDKKFWSKTWKTLLRHTDSMKQMPLSRLVDAILKSNEWGNFTQNPVYQFWKSDMKARQYIYTVDLLQSRNVTYKSMLVFDKNREYSFYRFGQIFFRGWTKNCWLIPRKPSQTNWVPTFSCWPASLQVFYLYYKTFDR